MGEDDPVHPGGHRVRLPVLLVRPVHPPAPVVLQPLAADLLEGPREVEASAVGGQALSGPADGRLRGEARLTDDDDVRGTGHEGVHVVEGAGLQESSPVGLQGAGLEAVVGHADQPGGGPVQGQEGLSGVLELLAGQVVGVGAEPGQVSVGQPGYHLHGGGHGLAPTDAPRQQDVAGRVVVSLADDAERAVTALLLKYPGLRNRHLRPDLPLLLGHRCRQAHLRPLYPDRTVVQLRWDGHFAPVSS